MLIGYARTSTLDQIAGLDAQLRDLKAADAEKVFGEQLSSVASDRPQLNACIEFVRAGDSLVVTRLDRLARSIHHLLELVATLERERVALRILSLGIDTATPTGKLVLTILGAIAEFERTLMLERQREGIQKAKSDGKYKGRVPTAQRKTPQILALRAEGLGATAIAKHLGIHRASVHRVLADKNREKPLTTCSLQQPEAAAQGL